MSDDKDDKAVKDEDLDNVSGGSGTGTQFPGGHHNPPRPGTGTEAPHPVRDPA